jgi:hypothetical protein
MIPLAMNAVSLHENYHRPQVFLLTMRTLKYLLFLLAFVSLTTSAVPQKAAATFKIDYEKVHVAERA